jgi:signal transduction histidine kinase
MTKISRQLNALLTGKPLRRRIRKSKGTAGMAEAESGFWSRRGIKPWLFESLAENAARVCADSDAIIFLKRNGALRHVAHYGSILTATKKGESGPPIDDRRSVPGRAFVDGQTVHVHDVQTADEFPLTKAKGVAHGVRTSLAMPLLHEGVPMGVILMRRTEVLPFSDKEIALVKIFVDQAARAFENGQLFREIDSRNHDLAESLAQQTATSEILRVMASSPTDLQPVLNTVAENAARICEANDALIYRFDGRRFEGVAEYGPLPRNYGKGPPVLDRRSVPGRAVIERSTVHVEDLSALSYDELRADFLRRHGTRTVLATPLMRESNAVGVIVIRRMEVRPFSNRQIALLETFADQAVIAIENVRLFREIQEKSHQLEVANERLTELDRLKSDFVSNVSHELRTPLTAIKGAVDLVLREMAGPLTEKQTHYLSRVRSNTQHLAGLINDLLDLSKIESGKIEVKSSRVSLGGLVHEVVETLRPVAAEKDVTLEAVIAEPSILVWADRDKINQVLMNLIGNAIKFTPAQGRVTVSAARDGKENVQVSVSDTGAGIAAEEAEKIFDKFYQIKENGGPKPKGTGLGLAICKALVDLHGGRIWVKSEINRGSTFSFALPLSAPLTSPYSKEPAS